MTAWDRDLVIAVLFFAVGVVHLLPIVGVLGSEWLTSLYGRPFTEPNLTILMRHRAVLFGCIGALLIGAAFAWTLQPVGWMIGVVSLSSFLWIARSVGGYNAQLTKLFMIDVVAFVALLAAAALRLIPF